MPPKRASSASLIRSRLELMVEQVGVIREYGPSSWPRLAGVPATPLCPYCEAPVGHVETTEAASSNRGGFRVILVACPSCNKVIGIGGLARPSSSGAEK
jgi:hypothetical protein